MPARVYSATYLRAREEHATLERFLSPLAHGCKLDVCQGGLGQADVTQQNVL